MPDLLLELRSEEIPARMQRKAAGDLKKLVTDALVEAGLTYEGAREYWTPRRLTLDIRGLDARSKDSREERKGPKVGAPAPAIEGFLRSVGLASIGEATIQSDKKGEFYVAVVEKPGRPAEEIVAAVMPGIVRDFPWPKSMRWGPASAKPGSLRWVRPLQSILCVFGPEIGETAVVEFEVGGVRSGDRTAGHRFHAPDEFKVRRFEDYVAKLEAARVVLDAERRKEIIRTDAQNLAFAQGLEIVEDEGLLEEVAGLVEWPVVLMGEFEEAFLAIPPEMIRLTIRANQKCFVTRRQGEEVLSNRFLLVAAIEASDHGAETARGNGKVVRARLSDALYFWNTDQHDLPDRAGLEASASAFGLDVSKPLDQRMAKLDALGVTFHAKLGTQGERVKRIASLAETLAPIVGADPALARRAAVLAKADLTTEAVGEFPELQGLMGRRYAALQGEHESVQVAIEDHWKPAGPSDRVPSDPVAIAVALADKLDTLVGFWAIDEKPTGSKDPYALRRAALGVIRIVLENGLRLQLERMIAQTYQCILDRLTSISALRFRSSSGSFRIPESQMLKEPASQNAFWWVSLKDLAGRDVYERTRDDIFDETRFVRFFERDEILVPLIVFFHDRLKVQLRESGARHDLVDAVLSGGAAYPSSGPSGHLLPAGEKNAASASAEERHSSPLRGEGGERSETDEGSAASTGNAPATKDDLLDIAARVAALGTLLETEDGKNLLAAYRRAANILAAEEKKGTSVAASVDPALFAEPQERALFDAVERAEGELSQALESENYSEAMAALARLRAPADAFFDKVLVNAEDDALRANRLALLARIRTATERVADFSRIGGGG